MRASWGLGVAIAASVLMSVSCETVDPGPNFQLPTIQFNANYFYCTVEPEFLMGGLTHVACGDNGTHGCHYSDKVPEMALTPLPQPVKCAGGVPVNSSDVANGTPAANNLATVSLQMSAVYTTAPLYLWPSQLVPGHPVAVFHVPPTTSADKSVVNVLQTWATQ